MTHITSPKLKKETAEFYNDCYVPAYSKFMSGSLSHNEKNQIKEYQKKYGHGDLGWIGSVAFLNTPGLYNSLSAQKPIKGFLFDPTRDQYEGQVSDHSKWGEPNCQAWWSDPENGLHAKLKKALPASFLTTIAHIGDSRGQLADAGIRNLIQHSFDHGMSLGEIARGYESLDQETKGNFGSEVASKIGVSAEGISYFPKLTLLVNALPVIQALLLMTIYALLALAIPFSSYRLHFIITGSAAIFAITFWSYLWHLVLYLDNTLIPALYTRPDFKMKLEAVLAGSINDQVFVDYIIGTLYIALPVLFLTIMTWSGLKVGNGIMGAISEMKAPGDAAGNKVGALANYLIRPGIGMIGKK